MTESVAFLEASINEFWAACGHTNLETTKPLSREQAIRVALLAPHVARIPTLDKYDAALVALDKPGFDKGSSPYQDVALVARVRNMLVHFEARWRQAGGAAEPAPEKIAQSLVGKGIARNPYTSEGNPFFPDKVLSHGYAQWSLRSCVAFVDALYERLGVRAPYDAHRSALTV